MYLLKPNEFIMQKNVGACVFRGRCYVASDYAVRGVDKGEGKALLSVYISTAYILVLSDYKWRNSLSGYIRLKVDVTIA